MKRKHGAIRELAECQAKPLPLTPPLRLLPASIAATAPANFAKTVFSIPHGARTRRVPNGCATPRLAASSASQSHTRRQSGRQPHTAKTGQRQRAQPSQKRYSHEQPAAWEELSGVTLPQPPNYANARRAGSAWRPQHPHRAKPHTCFHTPSRQGARQTPAGENFPTFREVGKEKR